MRLGAVEIELIALEQELQRVSRRHHARDALGAAGAGEQPDLDLGQAEAGLAVVGGDAVVAGEAKLEAAAERGAVDRRDERLAAGLDAPVELRQLAALVEQRVAAASSPLLLTSRRTCAASVSSIVRSAPAQNVSLPEVMTAPLIAASAATFSTIADNSVDHARDRSRSSSGRACPR